MILVVGAFLVHRQQYAASRLDEVAWLLYLLPLEHGPAKRGG